MNTELLETAVKSLSAEAVYLRSGTIHCKDDFIPQLIKDNLSLIPQYRVHPIFKYHIVTTTNSERGENTRIVMYYFVGSVRLLDGELQNDAGDLEEIPENEIYVEITSEFCAHYILDGLIDESKLRPALEEFGSHNVGYDVWPYWREYVQSVCTRLGIPPIPVPMYRISKTESENELIKE
jgi:hypothetical protein